MQRISFARLLCILSLPVVSFSLLAKDAKLKAEDLVAKHLAAIGTAEARGAVQNRTGVGSAQMISRLGSTGQLSGKSNILSEGRKVRLGMSFGALDYPGDQIAFDGEKVSVGQRRPGERSELSKFIYAYDIIVREGLLGGTLTTAWPLLDLTARQAKLDYTGIKKIEGRQLHEVKYRAKKGGGDLQIALYFDPESFRHVRTQYRLVQPALMAGDIMQSAHQRDTIYTLVENFDDFKETDGLTLPQSYKLKFTIEGQDHTMMTDWNVAVSQVIQNQQIDPKYFSVQF